MNAAVARPFSCAWATIVSLVDYLREIWPISCAPSRIRTCAHGSGGRSSGPLITPAEMRKCVLRTIRLRRQSAWVPDLASIRGG